MQTIVPLPIPVNPFIVFLIITLVFLPFFIIIGLVLWWYKRYLDRYAENQWAQERHGWLLDEEDE